MGVIAGVAAGLVVGAIVAVLTADRWGPRAAVTLVAFTVAGVGLGLFWGGFSQLESPRPGAEPSEVEHPIRDEPGITKDESPEGERRRPD